MVGPTSLTLRDRLRFQPKYDSSPYRQAIGQAILTGADLDRGRPASLCGWTAK